MLKKIKRRFFRIIAKNTKPQMIMGFKRSDGRVLQKVRIGTSTFIDHPHNFVLEEMVYIGHHNFIEASNGISIGEGVQITNFCNISTHSSHHSIRLYGSSYITEKDKIGYVKGAIHIGEYSFIGPFTVIMPGTTIGKGCIVKAYSYVKGEFPDYSIIGGNPATIVGSTKGTDMRYLEQHTQLRQSYYDTTE